MRKGNLLSSKYMQKFSDIFHEYVNIFKKIKFIFIASCKIAVFRKNRMVFLFGSPIHSNLGDQAQSYCLYKWFSNNYPNYGMYFFRLPETRKSLLTILRKTIRKGDMIVCHSGYHLTDLYHEQDVYCKLANQFRDRPIWIFPQTIHYQDDNNLKTTAMILNDHGLVTLMVRDEESYSTAKKYFYGCKLLLYPDIVTSLIGTKEFHNPRDGILFCFRNDVEAFYSKEQISQLKNKFNNIIIEETDTTLNMPGRKIINNREKVLNDVLDYYSRFKLIITDRYHGTILSLIAGTPVVVLQTKDHKLSSGVKWFPDSFKEYVFYAKTMDDAYEKAMQILSARLSYKLPAYFKVNYYDKLKATLENL